MTTLVIDWVLVASGITALAVLCTVACLYPWQTTTTRKQALPPPTLQCALCGGSGFFGPCGAEAQCPACSAEFDGRAFKRLRRLMAEREDAARRLEALTERSRRRVRGTGADAKMSGDDAGGGASEGTKDPTAARTYY